MQKQPLISKVLSGTRTDTTPVWLMRQAGRYLPEYRALKEHYSFLELCDSVELATEVTLQPINRFDVDAAIIFADILLPLQGMGIELDFSPGPIINNPIKCAEDVDKLIVSPGKALTTVPQIVSSVKAQLSSESREYRRAVLGFSGTPWTLFCYIINQRPYKHFQAAPIFAKSQKRAFTLAMDKITEVLSDYLLAQHEAGADAVQLFDSWGGILGEEDYKAYSLPWIEKLAEKLKSKGVPCILYCGNGPHLTSLLSNLPVNALSIDWRVPLTGASKACLKTGVALQGNLDPTTLFSSIEEVTKSTNEMMEQIPEDLPFVANLGHGVLQHTPIEAVEAFVNTVHGVSD